MANYTHKEWVALISKFLHLPSSELPPFPQKDFSRQFQAEVVRRILMLEAGRHIEPHRAAE